jgi:hypothetical protein
VCGKEGEGVGEKRGGGVMRLTTTQCTAAWRAAAVTEGMRRHGGLKVCEGRGGGAQFQSMGACAQGGGVSYHNAWGSAGAAWQAAAAIVGMNYHGEVKVWVAWDEVSTLPTSAYVKGGHARNHTQSTWSKRQRE